MEIEKSEIKTPEKNPARRKRSRLFLVFIVILAILISSTFGAIFGFMGGALSQKFFPNVVGKYFNFLAPASNKAGTNTVSPAIVEEDSAVINVVGKASPAVVSIVITKNVPQIQDFFSNPFNFPDFGMPAPFDQGQGGSGATQPQEIGGGSGFIIMPDGMIVTNKHVVSDTTADYTVITSDGTKYPAKILAIDPVIDIAVIKIDGANFSTLNFGDSDSLQIGQTVVAIGNSLGEFSNTVSKGIVSGLRRNVTASGGFGETENLTNIIQTDAAINPGNSGGPLLDINGDVIAINVAMAQGAQNIGFAIPSNQIKKVIDQVKTTGKISVPYLGVRYLPVTSDVVKKMNFPYNYGALVVRGSTATDFAVIPGSPADKTGIVENDVILEINGAKIDQNNGLADLLSKYSVGDTVSLKVWHKGDIKDVQVTLEERK